MYAQIDFSRESEHAVYVRVKFYDPNYCKLGASLGGVSLVEVYELLLIEMADLVRQSFIVEKQVGTIMTAVEEIFRQCGHGWYLDLHIDECSVHGTDILDRMTLRILDEDDRKDIPLAGMFLRKLTVDVQI